MHKNSEMTVSIRLFKGLFLWAIICFILSSLSCGQEQARRQCKQNADCQKSQPEVYCFEGFCSKQQCQPGKEQVCKQNIPKPKAGSCRAGYRTCNPEGLWSSCREQVWPRPEICDREDNNCDGKVDEELNCQCKLGEKQVCYNGSLPLVNPCKQGIQFCQSDHRWGKCLEQKLPKPEKCDGLDNDCDGKIDDLLFCSCTPGTKKNCYNAPTGCALKAGKWMCEGVCAVGIQICAENSKWSQCLRSSTPQKEKCDGVDNNCDGKVDEGCKKGCKPGMKQTCYSQAKGCAKKGQGNYSCLGICESGVQYCRPNQHWGACLLEVTPQGESCDNQDNDCDGQIDENLTQSCYQGPPKTLDKGICKAGTQICLRGRWGACKGQVRPTPNPCKDNEDRNCDGKIDQCSSPPALWMQWSSNTNGKDIYCVAWSPDETKLLTGHNGSVKFWDISLKKLIFELKGFSGNVSSVDFSPNGKYIAAGIQSDQSVRIWEVSSRKQTQVLKGHSGEIEDILFMHDSKNIYSASLDNTIRRWNVRTGRLTATIAGHKAAVKSIALGLKKKLLYSGSEDRSVHISNSHSGTFISKIGPLAYPIQHVSICKNGEILAVSSTKTLSIWDIKNKVKIKDLHNSKHLITDVKCSPNGVWLAASNSKGEILFWKLTGKYPLVSQSITSGRFSEIAWSPQSRYIASVGNNSKILIWRAP